MFLKTHAQHPDFIALTKALDADILTRYSAEIQNQYDVFNQVEYIETTIIGYENDVPMACGCFKQINASTAELKRIYTLPQGRGKGFATQLILHLEAWAMELGCTTMRLETGHRQVEAVALYQKLGYVEIPNYTPYEGMEHSLCMEKML